MHIILPLDVGIFLDTYLPEYLSNKGNLRSLSY